MINISNHREGSLVIAGSGIKFMSHLSTEVKAYISNSDLVLYLVNDPAIREWIQSNSKRSESLSDIYFQHNVRHQSYQAVSDYILDKLRSNIHICVVTYGHPTFLAQPTIDAVKRAREAGYYAIALPGISSLDCLLADLLIDPSDNGCQIFEATDLFIRKRQIDPSSHLVLLQVGYLGHLSMKEPTDQSSRLQIFSDYLQQFYPANHPVVIYEAAIYPTFQPHIISVALGNLSSAKLTPLSSLYLSPAVTVDADQDQLQKLDMETKGFS